MRIALIEDNPGDVRWFTLMIGESGLPSEISSFETGVAAIDAFRRTSPPDLIVTDWRLPILDFPDFIRFIRAIPEYEATPIAIVTSDSHLLRQKAQELGAFCCLEKPLDADQIRTVFGQVRQTSMA